MVRAIKNFHVPLPERLYAELRGAAEARGEPATKLAIELVKRGLSELQRVERQRQIAAYATSTANSADDLDSALETAGLAMLRSADR